MAEFEGKAEQRDYPREIIDAPTEIMIEGQWQQCLIVNISASGAKLYVAHKITKNMVVSLKIGKFDQFDAAVVWFQGDEVGVRFRHVPLEIVRLLSNLSSS